MLRKVVLDSDVGEGEGPATSTRRKRRSKQKTRLHKRQRKDIGARRRRGNGPVHEYSKWLEMRRKDRDDIERNKIHIRTMANLLHSIMQVPKTSSSGDPVATSHTPPATGDFYDPFVTSKRTFRQAFQTSKMRRRKVMTKVPRRRTGTWLIRI
jgi:hypothetical protein